MQSLLRAWSSLRGASVRASTRAFSTTLEESTAEHWGAKNKLCKLLGSAEQPLSAAEIWEKAQEEGLKSKRFMKEMLNQLKQAGYVRTQRLAGAKRTKSFVYSMTPRAQQSTEQGSKVEAAAP